MDHSNLPVRPDEAGLVFQGAFAGEGLGDHRTMALAVGGVHHIPEHIQGRAGHARIHAGHAITLLRPCDFICLEVPLPAS